MYLHLVDFLMVNVGIDIPYMDRMGMRINQWNWFNFFRISNHHVTKVLKKHFTDRTILALTIGFYADKANAFEVLNKDFSKIYRFEGEIDICISRHCEVWKSPLEKDSQTIHTQTSVIFFIYLLDLMQEISWCYNNKPNRSSLQKEPSVNPTKGA